MPIVKLTKRTIDALPMPSAGQVFYRDDALPGFGLRVGRRTRAFFVEGQVKRRTVRTTIGRYDIISPEERSMLRQICAGRATGRRIVSSALYLAGGMMALSSWHGSKATTARRSSPVNNRFRGWHRSGRTWQKLSPVWLLHSDKPMIDDHLEWDASPSHEPRYRRHFTA